MARTVTDSVRNRWLWHYVIVGEDTFYGLTAGGVTFTDLCHHRMVS